MGRHIIKHTFVWSYASLASISAMASAAEVIWMTFTSCFSRHAGRQPYIITYHGIVEGIVR